MSNQQVQIFNAGGNELVSFVELLKHVKSCEVCMLEEEGLLKCDVYETLLDAWEINRLKSLKVVLDVTESI